MRMLPFFAVALAFAATLTAEIPPARTHLDYRRECAAAFARNDFATARTACEAALHLRPDSPRYLYNLALIAMRAGQPTDALSALHRLAALGIYLGVEHEETFAPLRGQTEFVSILGTLAANRAPRGQATVLLTLPAMTGIIEGLAFRKRTGEFFFGDVRQRCVWRRAPDGRVARFSPPGAALLGVFQLAIDEPRGLLWAATSMVSETTGCTATEKGRAALVALDLSSGKLLHTYPLPPDHRDHVLGDLLLAPDGTVYATDSAAPLVWQLAPGAARLQPLVESPSFNSLQGLGLVAGGHKLLVTDYANGLFTIDLATRVVQPLAPPAGATLLGLDGLLVDGDAIVAVQNGVDPQRLVRLALAPDATRVTHLEVLAAALPNFADLTLLTVGPDGPAVIAGSGWATFDSSQNPPASSHPVRIFRLGPPALSP